MILGTLSIHAMYYNDLISAVCLIAQFDKNQFTFDSKVGTGVQS